MIIKSPRFCIEEWRSNEDCVKYLAQISNIIHERCLIARLMLLVPSTVHIEDVCNDYMGPDSSITRVCVTMKPYRQGKQEAVTVLPFNLNIHEIWKRVLRQYAEKVTDELKDLTGELNEYQFQELLAIVHRFAPTEPVTT